MRRQPVTSSTMRSVGYAADQTTLEIEFTSGAVYRYLEVPPAAHAQLLSAESLGAYFNTHIRPAFPFRRMREE